jgi:5-methylcytosine-specific restriction endonuclease McrA
MKKRDSRGRFLPTPRGKKTAKMIEIEKKLGKTLEEDFDDFYVKRKWGQKRLANRWGVPRNLIFAKNLRGKRRSWSQMLNLPVRLLEKEKLGEEKIQDQGCEICLETDIALDRAHWVAASKGGSNRTYNILNLCPNCHRKLDNEDEKTVRQAKETLLFREVKKIIQNHPDTQLSKKKLRRLCEAIIKRKPLKELE